MVVRFASGLTNNKLASALFRLQAMGRTLLKGTHYSFMRFRDKWKIERMAAGHCTGQFAFAELIRIYAANFEPAGVGSVISLPS
jgi:hypothetical protein